MMENDFNEKFLKDFVDNIPEPVLILKKKSFDIEYANYEFQDFYKKSFNYLKKKKVSEIFKNDLFFLSNLREIISNNGTFFIKEALEFNSKQRFLCRNYRRRRLFRCDDSSKKVVEREKKENDLRNVRLHSRKSKMTYEYEYEYFTFGIKT